MNNVIEPVQLFGSVLTITFPVNVSLESPWLSSFEMISTINSDEYFVTANEQDALLGLYLPFPL